MPPWVQYLQAFATPCLSALALLFTWLSYRSNEHKRRNDIFDRRYEFYKDFRDYWLRTGAEPGRMPELPPMDILDLIPVAEEAHCLFGDDVRQHILSLADKSHCGTPGLVGNEFSGPFLKYLRLK